MPSIEICTWYFSPRSDTPIKPVVALGFPCFFGGVLDEGDVSDEGGVSDVGDVSDESLIF